MSELRPSLRTAIAKALDRTDEMRGALFHERITVIEDAVLDVIVDGIMANDEPLTEGDLKAVEEFNQIIARIKAKIESQEPEATKPTEWPKPGDKMRYLDEGGYDGDRDEARKHFTKDQVLSVRDFHLGDWNSTIAFEGVPGWFNSVMFEHIDEAAE